MNLPILKHEDERRLLIEVVKDYPIRTFKVIYIKDSNGILGAHYHKKKDDIFFLIKGSGTYTLEGKTRVLKKGIALEVKSPLVHSFKLKKNSILLEASTTPYDKEDEYEVSE